MVWQYEKFKGDMAIYAFCPKCNFYHNPSVRAIDETGKWDSQIKYQYNYCPICGEYLYDDKADENGFEVVWNERNVEELYDIDIKD